MSNLHAPSPFRAPSVRPRRRQSLAAVLIVLALAVSACASGPEPTTAPTAAPAVPPTATPTVPPTLAPAASPTPAPTDTPAADATVTPSVSVADQPVVDGTVTIAQVVSDGPGWLVIHAQADGRPGPILGYSPVVDGLNSNVSVQIDLASATITLYAMLHTDAGTVGTWEFPGGADAPVTVDGQIVSPPFALQVVSGEAEVEMEDSRFSPRLLVIRAGTTVKFANKDGVPHTATSDTNVWDTGYLSRGEDVSHVFGEAGVYPYYCTLHGGPGGVGMAATIVVLS